MGIGANESAEKSEPRKEARNAITGHFIDSADPEFCSTRERAGFFRSFTSESMLNQFSMWAISMDTVLAGLILPTFIRVILTSYSGIEIRIIWSIKKDF